MHPLTIAWVDLKRLLTERQAIFWIFVGPLIFSTFFGVLFRQEPPKPLGVAIVNKDSSDTLALALTAFLREEGLVVATAREAPPEGWAVEVPAGSTAAIRENRPVTLVLHAQAEESTRELNLSFKLRKALMTIYLRGNLNGAATPARGPDAIRIDRRDIGVKRNEVTAGFQRSVPAYLVMFTFLNLLISGAGIAEERASGKLRRLFIAPVRKRDIILGKLLMRFATGWIQIAYMLLLGVILFRIEWAEHPWVLFAFLSLFALATASFGLLLGTLFREPDKCANVAVWTAVLLSPLGGLWWPLEIVGPTMQTIGHFIPTGWAMEGVNSMLALGAGAADVWVFAVGFAVMTVISLSIAARRLTP